MKQNLTILHTNDIHSHLRGSNTQVFFTNGDENYLGGGISRIATKIKEIRREKRAQSEPTLLLDSGDFMVGTLYELLTEKFSPELTLINTLKYDAITLGNHELEFSPSGLAKIIEAVRVNGGGLTVPIICSNIQFNHFNSTADDLKRLYEGGVIRPYLIKSLLRGIRIGIIGLLGENAEEVAFSKSPLTFNHDKNFIQEMVNTVKNKGANLVICLSHSGVAEDEKLAHSTTGINVIISGHDHRALFEPVIIKDTIIVEAGALTKYLGELELSINEGKVFLRRYGLIPIDSAVKEDAGVRAVIDRYTALVDSEILNPVGLSFSKPIAKTSFDLVKLPHGESNLGDLVADAMRAEIDLYQPEHPVDFVFEATGFIGEDILKQGGGIITVSDIFQVLPLGIGPDKKPGYPLVSFYLNAWEIKSILEMSVLLSSLKGRDYFLQVSGFRFWYNPQGEIFKKVERIEKWDPISQSYLPIDISNTTILYKIGCNLQIAKFIAQAIILKDSRGKPINIFTPLDSKHLMDFTIQQDKYLPGLTKPDEDKILVNANSHTSGVQELKQWRAFIHYLSNLSDLDGDSIPDIPPEYAKPQGRILNIQDV